MDSGQRAPGRLPTAPDQAEGDRDRLARTERALLLAQRAMEEQQRRVRLLNGYALVTSTVLDPTEILRLALRLLFELFPFEEGVAFLRWDDRLRPAAAHSVHDPDGNVSCIGRVRSQPTSAATALGSPRFWTPRPGEAPPEEFAWLVHALEAVFEPASATGMAGASWVVLPLWQGPDALAGVVVLRRRTPLTAFERPLPSDQDRDFVAVVGNQIAASVGNALLFEDLRQSYAKLAAAHEGLVQKERLAAVGELAAQIAHEVRNPLGAILNSVSRLRKLLPDSEEEGNLVAIVAEESERLARMVEDLLEFARPREPSFRPEDLGAVVRSALEGAARVVPLDRIEQTLEVAEDLPPASVDAPMIRQAVLNLVTNAAQAMSGKGRLRVRVAVEQQSQPALVRIEVSDTGPGIPPDVAARLFQPFFTTRASGTGLGLAVVRRFAEAHHGVVSFRSTPGQGSTFTLTLPVRD